MREAEVEETQSSFCLAIVSESRVIEVLISVMR